MSANPYWAVGGGYTWHLAERLSSYHGHDTSSPPVAGRPRGPVGGRCEAYHLHSKIGTHMGHDKSCLGMRQLLAPTSSSYSLY